MRNNPDAVMLFAAGFGTRMAPLTKTCPKPMIPVAGKPLLDHALDLAADANLSRKVVNTHYLADQIATHLADQAVQISHETPNILDTGGGLRHALPLLGDGPVFTMNTDAVWTGPNPFDTLRKTWAPTRMEALLLLVPADRALGHESAGDFSLAADGQITRGPGYVYSGAQILNPKGLHDIPKDTFSLNVLWSQMASQGRLFGAVHPGGWCDVGHPAGIATAEAMLNNPPELLP